MRRPWTEFIRDFDWRQGQHVMLIGPTDSGKSTMARAIIQVREQAGGFIAVLVSKPRDSTMAGLQRLGYHTTRKWPPRRNRSHILLWPPFRGPKDMPNQREQFEAALGDMFAQGNWAIYVDELFYASSRLNLDPWLKTLWTQGRAMGVSFVGATQRPRNVPLEGYSNSSHIFIWKTADDEDLRRLSGIGGMPNKEIREQVQTLERYEALYIDVPRARMERVKAPIRRPKTGG